MSSVWVDTPVDLRLIWPLVGLWCGALLAFAIVVRAGWQTLLLLVVIAVFARLAQKSGAMRLLLLVTVIAAVAVMLRWSAAHSTQLMSVVNTIGSADLTFTVLDDPHQRRSSRGLDFSSQTSALVDVTSVDGTGMSFPALLSTESGGLFDDAAISSEWSCRARVKATQDLRRYIAFAHCSSAAIPQGGATRLQTLASRVRQRLREVTVLRHPTSEGAALLPGLVLGDTSAQSDSVTRDMKMSGLGHLTAVSGANLAITAGAVLFLLKRTRLSPLARLIALVMSVLAFVVVARPSPSVVRAAAMALISLWCGFRGVTRHGEIVLFLSVSLLLIADPMLALSWGFALSVAATAGLIVLPRLWKIDHDHPWILRAVATAAAAGLATLPLLIAMGARPTFATIPANVLAEILVAPATVSGVVAAVLAAVGLSMPAALVADFGSAISSVIVLIAHGMAKSVLAVPVISWTGMFVLLGSAALWRNRRANRWTLLTLSVVVLGGFFAVPRIAAMASPWPPAQWEVVACDVGQGDASVINGGEAGVIVIDAGPEPDAIDRCLHDLRVTHVALFIASHFHADHVGGISGVMRGRQVDRVIADAFAQPAGGRTAVQLAVHAPIEVAAQQSGAVGTVQWQIIKAGQPDMGPTDDGTVINNSSAVVLIRSSHHRVLFTGDIEAGAQQELMARMHLDGIDAVKIAHHGSRYQEAGFAQWVHARFAWASVGRDNTFGHPAVETLAAFRAAGALVLTTMDCGDIALTASGVSPRRACRPA